MVNQDSIDQAYDAAVDDYLTWDIHLLSDINTLYFIEKFWLMPALEDVSVLKIQEMYEAYEERRNTLLF